MFHQITKEVLVVGLAPQRWTVRWSFGCKMCFRGCVLWLEGEAAGLGSSHETQVVLPLGLPPVAPALSWDVGSPHVGYRRLSSPDMGTVFWPHSPHAAVSRSILEGLSWRRVCLHDLFLLWVSGISCSFILMVFIIPGIHHLESGKCSHFLRHIGDKSPFNVVIWFKCFLNYVDCVLPLAIAYPFFFF